ncbi:MAG: hypothetical protein KatS3mg052_0464 [Candidatus Roseilinea sp.]|nr:MAG: hypothetical protein KatS3mg052_0464 [Candidatus Roseilinea sp.]
MGPLRQSAWQFNADARIKLVRLYPGIGRGDWLSWLDAGCAAFKGCAPRANRNQSRSPSDAAEVSSSASLALAEGGRIESGRPPTR